MDPRKRKIAAQLVQDVLVHPPRDRTRSGGYVLITVVVMLAVLASVVFLVNFEGAMGANSASRAFETRQARYVAEAGYSQAKWLLAQNTTCTGYVDLASTAFGLHAYSATTTPVSGSPVTLAATGNLSTGAKHVLTQTVKVYQTPDTILLQPGAEGEDTYLWDGAHKNKNFGVTPVLSVNNASAERTTLIRFDLSAIPVGAKITDASLELLLINTGSVSNGVVDVHQVTQSWIEGEEDDATPFAPGATYFDYDGFNSWVTMGGDYDPIPVDSITIPSVVPGWYVWDVTEPVQSWMSGGVPNDGLLLRASGGTVDKIEFRSSDASGFGEHPKLNVTYTCECGLTCAPPAVAPTVVLSVVSATTLGGLDIQRQDLAGYDPDADTGTFYLDASLFGATPDVVAVHFLMNGHIVLSTGGNAALGGLDFDSADLVEYDPIADTASVFLNARAFPTPADIDALHILDDGHLVLSTDTPTTLGGLAFTEGDLVEYDPVSDNATLFFDGGLFSSAENVDAVDILENGHLLLSTEGEATLGGLSFSDTDVVDYDPVSDSATLYLDESVFSPPGNTNAVDRDPGAGIVLPPTPPPPAPCGGTFLDEFRTLTYSGSDANGNWSGDWVEINEGDGPTTGDIQIRSDLSGRRLQLKRSDEGVEREVDLSGYATATLSYDYRRVSLDSATDYVAVAVSSNGGASWTELGRLEGAATDSTYQSETYDIGSHIAPDTRIRFLTSSSNGINDRVYVDNVTVCADN